MRAVWLLDRMLEMWEVYCKKAKELLSVNKGEENKMYAQTKWNTSAISRQLAEVYRCLKNE